jgi:hypothetical protein
MKTPKFCRDCIWSKPEERSEWNLKCHHPEVVCKDEWALSGAKNNGSSTQEERKLTWNPFSTPACGREGKLYEPRT